MELYFTLLLFFLFELGAVYLNWLKRKSQKSTEQFLLTLQLCTNYLNHRDLITYVYVIQKKLLCRTTLQYLSSFQMRIFEIASILIQSRSTFISNETLLKYPAPEFHLSYGSISCDALIYMTHTYVYISYMHI